MEDKPIKSNRDLLEFLNEHRDALQRSFGDHMPAELKSPGDMLEIANLISDGQTDAVRLRLLSMVEQYPHDFLFQQFAAFTFEKIGMLEEACKCLIMLLALEPDSAKDTCKHIANYMYRSGAPKRARTMLDIGWEHEKKNIRRKDLEAAKEKYYSRFADKS